MKHSYQIKTPPHLFIALWLFIGVVVIGFFPFFFSSFQHYQENRYNETLMMTIGIILLSGIFGYVFYHWQKLYKIGSLASIQLAADQHAFKIQQRMLFLLKEEHPQEKKLTLLMEEAAELLGVRFAGIGLFDAQLHLKSLVHIDNKMQEVLNNFVYTQDHYAALIKSMSSGITLPIDDINADPRTQTIPRDFPEKKQVTAILYAPLNMKNSIVGACWFETEYPRKWSVADNRLAAFVAEVVTNVFLLSQHKKEENKLLAIQHQFATLKEKSEWGMAYFSLHSPVSTQTPFSESKVLLQQAQLTEANLAFSKMFHTTAKKNAKLDDFLIGKPDALLLEFFSQGYVLKEKEFLLLDGKGIRRYVKGGLIGIVENAHLVGCWLTVIDITEQKVSEQYYRQMTESASNMMTLLDKENRIVFDNDAVLHTLGFDKTARLNQTILHYVHPDDTDLLQELLKRTWQQLTPLDFAGLRFRAKDSSYITGDGALVPIKRNDVFNGILLEFRVNQERNLLEKTLFNEVRFFKGIAEAIDEVIVLLDKEGNILYDNQAIERIFGYKSSLRIGRYGFEYVHSDDIQEVSQLFRLALENPHVHYQKDIHFLHAQGEWKNVVIHLQNELDNENIKGVILRIAEQTEQIQAKKSQERENEIFKSLVQYSPNTYLILDEKATIKFGSEEVKRSLGYHPQELEGRNFLKLVHPHNKNAVLDNFRLLQSSPDSKVEFQVNIQHDNGEWRTMQIVGKWMTKNETFLGILLEMSDVSQTFQRINSLQEQLAFYQALNDSSGCLILLLEPDGALLYANPMAERLLGLQAPASLKDYLHDEDWQTLSVVFEQLADNPTQRSYLKIRTATSQKYWAICTNASLRSTVKGILLELINGELFLEEEKPQPALKNWIVLPHTTLLELDHNENILSANGASEEIFGVENHRLLQLPIYQFLDTSSHEIFRKSLTDARQLLASSGTDKQIRPLSFFCLHPNGEKTYVEAFLIVFLHETGCQLYLQNASDKYWQRKELINQRWINDRTQELVAVVEENGTIRFANNSFHKVFHLYEGDNIIGILSAFHQINERKEIEAIFEQIAHLPEKVFEVESSIRLENGKHAFLKIYVQNLLNVEPIHAILLKATDITELHITRRDLQEEINALNAEMLELTERIRESYQKEIQSLKEQLAFAKEHALAQAGAYLQLEEQLMRQKEYYEHQLNTKEESAINTNSLTKWQQALATYDWHVSKAKMGEAGLKACLSFIRHYQELGEYFLERLVEIKTLLKMYEEIGQTTAFQNVFKHVNKYRQEIQWEQTYYALLDKEKELKDLIRDTKIAKEYVYQLLNDAINDKATALTIRHELQKITSFYPSPPHQISYQIDITDDFQCTMLKGQFVKITVEILSLLAYTLREEGTIHISQWQENFSEGICFLASSPTKNYRRPEILLQKTEFFTTNINISPMQSIPLLALQQTLHELEIPLHIDYEPERGITIKIDLTKIIRVQP